MANPKPQASTSSNHAKAPKCAAFVKNMREVFGDVEVLWVSEGEVVLSEPEELEYATCYMGL